MAVAENNTSLAKYLEFVIFLLLLLLFLTCNKRLRSWDDISIKNDLLTNLKLKINITTFGQIYFLDLMLS